MPVATFQTHNSVFEPQQVYPNAVKPYVVSLELESGLPITAAWQLDAVILQLKLSYEMIAWITAEAAFKGLSEQLKETEEAAAQAQAVFEKSATAENAQRLNEARAAREGLKRELAEFGVKEVRDMVRGPIGPLIANARLKVGDDLLWVDTISTERLLLNVHGLAIAVNSTSLIGTYIERAELRADASGTILPGQGATLEIELIGPAELNSTHPEGLALVEPHLAVTYAAITYTPGRAPAVN